MTDKGNECEAEIDAVLAEFDGDARLAIAAQLHDVAALAADFEASTSKGYVRGRTPLAARPTDGATTSNAMT